MEALGISRPLVITLVLTVLGTVIASVAQNLAQHDDWVKCAKGGLAAGLVAAIVAYTTFVLVGGSSP